MEYIFPMAPFPHINVPGTPIVFHPEIPIFYARISTLLKGLFTNPDLHQIRPVLNQVIGEDDFKRDFLSRAEKERLNRFKALKKQLEWACGRFMIKSLARAALSLGDAPVMAADRPLADIALDYREKGAPFLVDAPEVSITLSHSGDFTAAGISLVPGTILGLDIEAIGPMPDANFLKTAFTPNEIRDMGGTPKGVFRAWTLKEAYLKYIGMGFNENLHRVEIMADHIVHHGKTAPVEMFTTVIEDSYSLSIVTGPDPD